MLVQVYLVQLQYKSLPSLDKLKISILYDPAIPVLESLVHVHQEKENNVYNSPKLKTTHLSIDGTPGK